jgi:hypothetical protein
MRLLFRIVLVTVFLPFLACITGSDDAKQDLVREAVVSPHYPLKLGPAGSRYLVDQDGVPFLWVGDSAWSLAVQLSLADAQTYLDDRQAKGFDVVLVNLIEHQFAKNAPANIFGEAPFTGRPFATPNDAYFARVDAIVQAAATRGMAVLLDPLYLGFQCGGEGWCAEVTAATTAEMRSWGQYVGTRYGAFDNVMWIIGGDADPTPVVANVREFVAGILDVDTRHLITAHVEPESYATTHWGNDAWLNINDVYTYSPTLYQTAQTAYQYAPTMPFFLVESAYENEHSSTPQSLRAQAYWTMLMGGMGQNFGNCPIWHFDATSSFCAVSGWKTALASAGASSMQYLAQLFGARPWYTLVPDSQHAALTAGYGTFGSATYVVAAHASDGATIIAYVPSSATVTIDFSKISGTTANVWWFNPSDGTAISAGTHATNGTQAFTSPSASDWVLVVDDAARGWAAPGPIAPPSDTVVTFEDQVDNAVLSQYGGITWGTGAGGWRVWDGGSVYTKNAFVNSTSRSEVTATFTLPANKVLKSLKLAAGSGKAVKSVKLSSAGNADLAFTDINGTYKTKTTGWTTASSAVTVKITCTTTDGASDVTFDDITYGVASGATGGTDAGTDSGSGGGTDAGTDTGTDTGGPPPNQPPTVATAASATPPTGKTTTLSVLGADDGGEAALTYTWSSTGVTFAPNGTNAAKSSVATFPAAGSYHLVVTIKDAGGLTATSAVDVSASQTITTVSVTPASASVVTNATQQFSATGKDQFGATMSPPPTWSWSASGGGTISTTGLFTAGTVAGGPFTITASAGVSGTASVNVSGVVDTTVTFEDQADNALLRTYGGITWSTSPAWNVWAGGATYTKVAFVNDLSKTAVSATFTLPAGDVLKSMRMAVGSGGSATITLASPGNTTRSYSIGGSYTTASLGWTASAPTVTVTITCATTDGASDVAFDNIVYGVP